MKSVTVAILIALSGAGVAQAKGGRQVFNAPYEYDYSREKNISYVKDHCEDAVGNHVYCSSTAASRSKNGGYLSKFPPN